MGVTVGNHVEGFPTRNFTKTTILQQPVLHVQIMSAKCGFNFTMPQSKAQPIKCAINRDLLRNIIELTTEPGDLVLDCFAGSGTAAAAAMTCFRHAMLMDRSPEMLKLAEHRLQVLQQEATARRDGGSSWSGLEHNF